MHSAQHASCGSCGVSHTLSPASPGRCGDVPNLLTRDQARIASQWEPVESGGIRGCQAVEGLRGLRCLLGVFGCGHSGDPGILCGMRGDTRRPTEQTGITLSLVPQPISPLRCNICSYAPPPLAQHSPQASHLATRFLASTKRCVCYQPMLHTPPGRLPSVSRRLAVHIP